MLFDGITLVQGSSVNNLTVSSGTEFPAEPHSGELFFRSDLDVRVRGLYIYILSNWFRIANTDSLSVPSGAALPAQANEADIFYLNSGTSSEGLYLRKNSQWEALTGSSLPEASVSGSSSTKVTKTAVSLGEVALNQANYTWTEVTSVCARGIMSRLNITSSLGGLFDVQIRDATAGGGNLWFEAIDVDGASFDATSPVYVEGSGSSSLFIGIKNRGSASRTFTLANLRVEKFA